MNDLLQSQIKSSCELALPNGLKELMWDISREVLRAQPQNIYDFIAQYLSALLVTRENLSIAAKVCDETCRAPCHVALEDKLRDIGLSEEDVIIAMTIIMDHFGKKVNEKSLLMKLIKKTNINEVLLPAIVNAVRSAFIEQHAYKNMEFETSTDHEDEVKQAAQHTLKLYEQTGPSDEEYNQMATKIQAAYRAYGVRRKICTDKLKEMEKKEKSLTIKDDVHADKKVPEMLKLQRANNRGSVTTESSISLAGSYVKLPKYTPYSAHDVHFYDYDETIERVHSSTNVLEDVATETRNIRFKEHVLQGEIENMNFDALSVEDDVLEADDESERTIEEHIHAEDDENMEKNINEINEMIESEGLHEADELGEEHGEHEMDEMSGGNEDEEITDGIMEELEANTTQNYELKITNEVIAISGSTRSNDGFGITHE